MLPEKFKELLDELDGNSLQTLKEKNARYAQNNDCLHNFRSGAEIIGGTPAQACWGYMTKHLVALRDRVEKDDFSNREDFLEKCQDTINYIRFLWCIGNDNVSMHMQKPEVTFDIDAQQAEQLHRAFILPNKEEAIKFIDHLSAITRAYRHASVSDANDLLGMLSCYGDTKIGWSLSDLTNVPMKETNAGECVIELPEPRKILD